MFSSLGAAAALLGGLFEGSTYKANIMKDAKKRNRTKNSILWNINMGVSNDNNNQVEEARPRPKHTIRSGAHVILENRL